MRRAAQDVAINTWLPVDGSLPLSSLATAHTDGSYYGGHYTQGPFGDYRQLISFLDATPEAFTADDNATRSKSDPNNYESTERVAARLCEELRGVRAGHLDAGARVEATPDRCAREPRHRGHEGGALSDGAVDDGDRRT